MYFVFTLINFWQSIFSLQRKELFSYFHTSAWTWQGWKHEEGQCIKYKHEMLVVVMRQALMHAGLRHRHWHRCAALLRHRLARLNLLEIIYLSAFWKLNLDLFGKQVALFLWCIVAFLNWFLNCSLGRNLKMNSTRLLKTALSTLRQLLVGTCWQDLTGLWTGFCRQDCRGRDWQVEP